MAANFDVIEQVGNVAKVDYGGAAGTGYRRMDTGEPTSQQAWAGANAAEQMERDEDGSFSRKKDEDEDEEPPDIGGGDGAPNIDVTVTVKKETKETKAGDKSVAKMEIHGVFPKHKEPTTDDLEEKMEEIAKDANENLPFVREGDISAKDVNIDKTPTRAEATGWDSGELDIQAEYIDAEPYDIDPSQARITDNRW